MQIGTNTHERRAQQMKKFHHLNLDKRIKIQYGLTAGFSYSKIAKYVNVNRSSVKREVDKYSTIRKKGANRVKCKRPTCNGCKNVNTCIMRKKYYDAAKAQVSYQKTLTACRSKPQSSKQELISAENVIRRGLKLGQSLYVILHNDKGKNISMSESTIRRYIDKNYFSFGNYMLPEKNSRRVKNTPKNQLIGVENLSSEKAKLRVYRLFSDFEQFVENNPTKQIVEFDTVHGAQKDTHCILTIMFNDTGLQKGLLVKKYDTLDVNIKVKELFSKFGRKELETVFPICIADNGIEFDLFPQIEFDENGEQIIHTFFTRPYTSTDKAKCERNHKLLRRIFPKGKSLDNLTQEAIDEAFSHLNSYPREILGGKTPYETFANLYGNSILVKLNIKKINKKEVSLKPKNN